MSSLSKTEEHPLKQYGTWAGNPKGHPFDPKRCAEEIQEPGRGILFHQCQRKAGHGYGGLFCKQHAKRRPA